MLLKLNKQAEVSEQQQVRWSHVYRLFPAEAGKKQVVGYRWNRQPRLLNIAWRVLSTCSACLTQCVKVRLRFLS